MTILQSVTRLSLLRSVAFRLRLTTNLALCIQMVTAPPLKCVPNELAVYGIRVNIVQVYIGKLMTNWSI